MEIIPSALIPAIEKQFFPKKRDLIHGCRRGSEKEVEMAFKQVKVQLKLKCPSCAYMALLKTYSKGWLVGRCPTHGDFLIARSTIRNIVAKQAAKN